jgi:hypothetical protein
MAEKEFVGDRRRGQEEEYFQKREQELIADVRRRREETDGRQLMIERSGVNDEQTLRALDALGYTPAAQAGIDCENPASGPRASSGGPPTLSARRALPREILRSASAFRDLERHVSNLIGTPRQTQTIQNHSHRVIPVLVLPAAIELGQNAPKATAGTATLQLVVSSQIQTHAVAHAVLSKCVRLPSRCKH